MYKPSFGKPPQLGASGGVLQAPLPIRCNIVNSRAVLIRFKCIFRILPEYKNRIKPPLHWKGRMSDQ